MTRALSAVLIAPLVIAVAGIFGAASESIAQGVSPPPGHKPGASAPAPQRTRATVAPHRAGPSAPAPRQAAPRLAAPRQAAPRHAAPSRQAISPSSRTTHDAAQRHVAPRDVGRSAAGTRNAVSRHAVPRHDTPALQTTPRQAGPRHAKPAHAITGQAAPRSAGQPVRDLEGGPLRGAKRVAVGGRSYSIWHGSHRVRRANGWRTVVGLSALGSLAIGAATYYPYAYIDAPSSLCDGQTEDGCQLRWQKVQTLEGPEQYQCVAYCPWQ